MAGKKSIEVLTDSGHLKNSLYMSRVLFLRNLWLDFPRIHLYSDNFACLQCWVEDWKVTSAPIFHQLGIVPVLFVGAFIQTCQ